MTSITILEATGKLSGRIHTANAQGFSEPVEKGVEFIHSNLPLTMKLLKKAGIGFQLVEGKMFPLKIKIGRNKLNLLLDGMNCCKN
ncbi:MAG: hypothetical protein C4308_10660 [Chitinophagaceae bacterium]